MNLLQQQLDKIKKENDEKRTQNANLRADLEKLGIKQEDLIKNSIASNLSMALQGKMTAKDTATAGKADKSEIYKAMPEVTPEDIKQLVDLDKNIERLFEIQMRKRNKNDEMIRNKINDLNEKPALRDFLFK